MLLRLKKLIVLTLGLTYPNYLTLTSNQINTNLTYWLSTVMYYFNSDLGHWVKPRSTTLYFQKNWQKYNDDEWTKPSFRCYNGNVVVASICECHAETSNCIHQIGCCNVDGWIFVLKIIKLFL